MKYLIEFTCKLYFPLVLSLVLTVAAGFTPAPATDCEVPAATQTQKTSTSVSYGWTPAQNVNYTVRAVRRSDSFTRSTSTGTGSATLAELPDGTYDVYLKVECGSLPATEIIIDVVIMN